MSKYMMVIKINCDKTETIEQIDLLDVDYIETEKRRIAYYIGDQKYYQITNKSELEEILNEDGFHSLDRTNIVNLHKIKKFDAEHGKVYFNENPTKKSFFATVARVKFPLIQSFIDKINGSGEEEEGSTKRNSIIKGLFKKYE